MTLANNYNPTKQLANGVTTSFTFNYDMINKDYATVYQEVDGVQTIVDSDLYTVEFNNNGGNVIFKTAPAAGVYIVIGRSVPLDQTTPYKTSSGFPANRVEENLDKMTAITQQLANESDRSPKIPLGTAGVDLNLPAPSAGKALVWNQAGNALTNSSINVDDTVAEVTAQADRAEDKADAAAASAAEALNSQNAASLSESAAQTSASQASASANEAAASAEEASQYAIRAAFGNIGDICPTTSTVVPNGGAWCDGAEYTKAAFPDLYQMLVDGKLQKTDYETFNSSVSTNGSCGFFGLDTSNERFKVPLLKDVYIKAGDTPLAFGEESLPNITGELGGLEGAAFYTSGAFSIKDTTRRSGGGAGEQDCRASFDASLSSSTYQDGAKVNPDHVVYRAYVVLYSSAAEASEAQAQEFMTALGGKANVALDNVAPAQSFKDMSVGWGVPDYDRAVSLTPNASFVAPFDGFVEIIGEYSNDNGFQFNFGDTVDITKCILRGAQSGALRIFSGGQAIIAKGQTYYFQAGMTINRAIMCPCKGVDNA